LRKLLDETGHSVDVVMRVANVDGPQVTGIARPSLIVPEDFCTFPRAERKAILLHEIAHLVRRDFAANLVQRVLLVVLWFQPAAWAIQRNAAADRELACDQWALDHNAGAAPLARALLRLAEVQVVNAVAMRISGSGNLGTRVRALISRPRNSHRLPLRSLPRLAAISATPLAVLGITATLAASDPSLADLYFSSAFAPVVAIAARDAAGTFELRVRAGKVIAAVVGARALSEEEVVQRGEYVTLLDTARQPMLSIRVVSTGRIEWQGRQPSTTSG
jgi:hypothetical protein